MGSHLTAEQARNNYIREMGKPLGNSFHALWQELAWLHARWREYRELFGTSPSRIDLLNAAAPFFFSVVQGSLWETIILHTARLTDPARSAGRANLTIRLLPELVDDRKTKEAVSDLVRVAIDSTDFCRDWRNRYLAHRDLELAIGVEVEPLRAASRIQVKQALEAIGNVLNAINMHYTGSTTVFDFELGSSGVESLLYVLDEGLKPNIGSESNSVAARKSAPERNAL